MIDSTLIGALCGFGASLAPELIDILKAHQEHQHRIAEKKLDNEAANQDYAFRTRDRNTRAATDELKALLEHDAALSTEHPFINTLRASVRPVITYLFVSLFLLVKCATLWHWVVFDDLPLTVATPLLWDDDTMSIFAAVLSFWFGSRALSQYRGLINTDMRRRRK